MNDEHNKSKLEEAIALFSGVSVQNKKQDICARIKKQNITYSSDLAEKMVVDLACMSTELIPHLPQTALLVDKYIKLIQEYNYNLPKARESEYTVGISSSLVSPKECVNILKNYIRTITQTIENTFNKHYAFLFENDCDELDEEIVAMRDVKISEKELLISRYKTLIYEYIVLLEMEIADTKKKAPKNPFDF